MDQFHKKIRIGSCIFYSNGDNSYYWLIQDPIKADVEIKIKNYDRILHQSLTKIFHESSLANSDQMKELHQNKTIKPILEQEPIFSEHFSKEELAKFPLLWIAVLGCYQDSAELLVRSGADVNEPFGCQHHLVVDEKWTILHVLLQMKTTSENERLIRLVTDHGADLQARDSRGYTVLHYAVKKGRVSTTEMLLETGRVNLNVAGDFDGKTPLILAADVASDEKAGKLLPLLMKHGADVLAKDRRGWNVLHCVANLPLRDATRCVGPARVLIENGASLDDRAHSNGHQPIHVAAVSGNYVMVKLYLDHGANVNALAHDDSFPLYLATYCPNIMVTSSTLLQRGANVHLKTKTKGRTALHNACKLSINFGSNRQRMEMPIGLLLTAGADVLAKDRDGKTPFALMNLSRENIQHNHDIKRVLKALALKKVCLQPSIELKDESIIEEHPDLSYYYQHCVAYASRMKFTRFIRGCTFLEFLVKSHRQIAELMRNPNFEANFKLFDRSEVSPYCRDICLAFQCAQNQYRVILKQEELINEAVGHILPYTVVRNIVHYFTCDDSSHIADCVALDHLY